MITRRILLAALSSTAISSCATAPLAFDTIADFPAAPVTPPLPNIALSRIALTSCSNPTRPLDMFDTVRARKPELLLMLGDNIYGKETPGDPTLGDLRTAYTQMAASQPFRDLVSSVPTQAIWDDHDYGINDGGGDFAYKNLAQRMFNSFWNVAPNDVMRRRSGNYRAFTIGPAGQRVQVIMLDTRSFRDPLLPTDMRGAPGKERYLPHPITSSADVLGAEQWAFLEAELKKPADLRIIASSIQVVADGHGYECWALFPRRRTQLYDLIVQTGAKGVVFVSGDRHYGSVNAVSNVAPYTLTDMTASAINMPFGLANGGTAVNEASTTRIGAGYGPVNFGMFTIDWTGGKLAMELIGSQGQTVLSHEVPFAQIGLVPSTPR
jgi:alkaline phosphatase D